MQPNVFLTSTCILLLADKVEVTDEQAVRLYLKTQKESFVELLYDRYSTKIFRKCISLVKDEALAQDLTQDIFIKIMLSLSKFKEKSKFSTWIYSITYNYCIDYIRKHKKRKFRPLEDDRDEIRETNDIEDKELFEIKSERLSELLEIISTEEKSILLMKYQDDMSIKDIQQVLGLSESAVKMRIKRAKEKVNKKYNQLYGKPI